MSYTFIVRFAGWLTLLLVSVLPLSGAVRSRSLTVPFIQTSPEDIFTKASAFQSENKLDSALIYYSWLSETHRGTDDPSLRLLTGKSLSEMGQIYYIYYNDYMSAYRCLSEAEAILRDAEDRNEYAVVLLNLGNLFNIYEYIFPSSSGGQTRGTDYYARSINEGVSSESWNLVCSAYINSIMVDMPFKVNEPLNRRMKMLLSDSIPQSTDDYRLASLLCEGTQAISAGRYKEAREIFHTMRDSIGLTGARDKYMADLCLSAVAVNEGNYEDAIECVSRVLTQPDDRNNADVYMEVYDLLSKFYTKIGRDDKSAEFRTRYFEAKDSITKLLVELEPTRIGLELEQLRDYAHKIDAEKQQTSIIAISLTFVVLLLAGVAIIIFRKNRQLTHKNLIIYNQTRSLLSENQPQESPDTATKTEKYRDSSLSDETKRQLIVRIDEVMGNIDEICDKNFSLQRLTTLIGSNTSYISRIINEHYKMSFLNLLNKYRVQEACRRMENTEKYGRLTIDAISESVGFNTRSTFTKAFRLHIGMLPSEYLSYCRNDNVG